MERYSLHDVPMFKKMSAAEVRLISEVFRTKRYKKGQTIFLEGEPYSGFYAIIAGAVSLYRLARDGAEVALHDVDALGIFGEAALRSGSDFYLSCAKAKVDSTVLFFPMVEFIEIMRNNAAFAIRTAEQLSVSLMDLNLKFNLLASTIEARVSRYLVNEIQLNESIKLPEPFFTLVLSKRKIADHLGMANASLSRNFRKLKDEKIIREVSKKIFVTDLKKLRRLAQR